MEKCIYCNKEAHKKVDLNSEEVLNTLLRIGVSLEDIHGPEVHLCSDCSSKGFNVCPECWSVVINGKLCDCHGHKVLPYGDKAICFPEYKGFIKDHDLRFGLEIETEFGFMRPSRRKDALSQFTKTLGAGFVKFKRDGSLRMMGVEFVSMPMYYEHYASMRQKWEDAFKVYESLGGNCDSKTGCHIHLSRCAFLGSAHIKNFIYGIIKNPRFTARIAGRKSTHYCDYQYGQTVLGFDEAIKAYIRKVDGRYYAVNLENEDTVELRIYQSSIKWSDTVVYLQHAYSMFEYTKLLTLNKMVFSVEGYREYVKHNAKRFPDLVRKI